MPNMEVSSTEPVRLSRWGYGPIYVGIIAMFTVIGTAMNLTGLLNSGHITCTWLGFIFLLVGAASVVVGLMLWVAAVIGSRVMRHIDEGQLVTTGVYGWVRHPIYSAFMLFFTGVLIIQANWWLLTIPPVFWMFLTVLMKNTEERWLHNTFGNAYTDYSKRVNRCIPMPPRRS